VAGCYGEGAAGITRRYLPRCKNEPMNEKAAAPRRSLVSKAGEYLTDSREELRKVHFPTRQETMRMTWVVLTIIVFIAVCLFIVDRVFFWLMGQLVG
jgi:preprotein translocase SecE subunit